MSLNSQMHKPKASVGPIDPDFSFRVSADEIRASYESLDAAFDAGAYLLVVEYAEANSELSGCALSLGGFLQQGLSVLGRLPALSPRGLLCKAFAEWSFGDDKAARASLRSLPSSTPYSAKGRALLDLIDRDQVTVFMTAAFLPVPTIANTADSAYAPVHRYGRFLVKYVASQLTDNAYLYEPHMPFDRFIEMLTAEDRPDFIFAATPQWIPPKNFEKVSIPKVIWCHDTDVFIYRAHDNLALFDVQIVNTSQEQFELGRIFGGFCVSNLMLEPLSPRCPDSHPVQPKDFDVIFTGQALSIHHPEKARFIYELAELSEEYKVAVFDEYLPQKDYFDLLSRSKFLPIINRYAGCPSPRWRDALANSTFVLHPRGTAYGRAFPGCFAFDSNSMAQNIREHLRRHAAGKSPYDPARTGREIDTRLAQLRVSREELFERLLKFAAFSALVMRQSSKIKKRTPRRRLAWMTPCIDGPIYGLENIRRKIARMADTVRSEDLSDAVDFNNLAHLYGQLALYYPEASESSAWRARADELFAEGCRRYPLSLALHFNQAHWRFFRNSNWIAFAIGQGKLAPGDSRASAVMFRYLLKHWNSYESDLLGQDIGFAHTLLYRDKVFPYFEYGQQIVSSATVTGGGKAADRKTETSLNILRAAAYGYLGWEAIERDNFTEGFRLFVESLRINSENLPLKMFFLDCLLCYWEMLKKPDRTVAGKICDIFLMTINQYPGVLVTYTHRICEMFIIASRADDLRHVLAGWYRLSNVMCTTKSKERFDREINWIIKICDYSDYLPQRLLGRLAAGGGSPTTRASLTQFENLALSAINIRKAALLGANITHAPYYLVPYSAELDASMRMLPRHRLVLKEILRILSSTRWAITRPLREWRQRSRRLSLKRED